MATPEYKVCKHTACLVEMLAISKSDYCFDHAPIYKEKVESERLRKVLAGYQDRERDFLTKMAALRETLRDKFAMAYGPKILLVLANNDEEWDVDAVSKESYRMADAMLKAKVET